MGLQKSPDTPPTPIDEIHSFYYKQCGIVVGLDSNSFVTMKLSLSVYHSNILHSVVVIRNGADPAGGKCQFLKIAVSGTLPPPPPPMLMDPIMQLIVPDDEAWVRRNF